MSWLGKTTRKSGWLAVELDAQHLRYVQGSADGNGKPRISLFGQKRLSAASESERVAKDLGLRRHRCSTLLKPGEYQILQIEAPAVPQAEVREAVRWRLKDLLDYPADQATLDVLRFPPQAEVAGRSPSLYAVAARNEFVRSCMERFLAARLALSVIDIPEMAQRNIATLCEEEGRGLAMLHADEEACTLTINFRAELLIARRIEIGCRHFEAGERERTEGFERIALEMQRTFDLLDRQYPGVVLSRLLVGPMAQDFGLTTYLQQNLGMRIEALELARWMDFEGAVPEPAVQWRLFHLLGAALRH